MNGAALAPPQGVFYAIHPREELAHVVRLPAAANGRARRLVALVLADCGSELGKEDWQRWALVAERDFPLAAAPGFPRPVVDVCEACKANAPPVPIETEPPPAAALTERPPRKASEIAEELERIRDEVRSPRLRYHLTRAIECLRGLSRSSRTAGAP